MIATQFCGLKFILILSMLELCEVHELFVESSWWKKVAKVGGLREYPPDGVQCGCPTFILHWIGVLLRGPKN